MCACASCGCLVRVWLLAGTMSLSCAGAKHSGGRRNDHDEPQCTPSTCRLQTVLVRASPRRRAAADTAAKDGTGIVHFATTTILSSTTAHSVLIHRRCGYPNLAYPRLVLSFHLTRVRRLLSLLAACRPSFHNLRDDAPLGKKNGTFCPFLYNNAHFAKTGSGQT